MNPWRSALLGGLAYGLPYAVWLVAGLESGPAPPDLRPAHSAFLWTQGLALAVLLPAVAADTLVRRTGALLVLLALPWPLLVLVTLTGVLPAAAVAKAQAGMALLAVALALLSSVSSRAAAVWRPALEAAPPALLLLAAAFALGRAGPGGWL
jgi:hypothetical protein